MKKIVLNIFILLFTFNVALFGSSAIESQVSIASSVERGEAMSSTETVEVSLDSFGTLGIVLLVGLSSLLGAFFIKDA